MKDKVTAAIGMSLPNRTGEMNVTTTLESYNDTTRTESFMELAESYWMYKVGKAIDEYWFVILFPFGFFGNLLSTCVMSMKHNRHFSTCVYMLVISINDNVVTITSLYNWLLTNYKINDLTDIQCKVHVYFLWTCVYWGSYQIVLMTFDKTYAMKYPHKASTFCTPKRARINLALSLLFILVFNSPHLYFVKMINADVGCLGYAVQGWYVKAYAFLSFIVTSLVPCLSLIIMNSIIIKTVRSSRKLFREKYTPKSEKNVKNKSKESKLKSIENQLTIMLVLVAFMNIILFFPSNVRFLYYQFVDRNASPKNFAGFFSIPPSKL